MRSTFFAAATVAAIALPAAAQSPSNGPKIDTGPISPARLSADVKVLADPKLAGPLRGALEKFAQAIKGR